MLEKIVQTLQTFEKYTVRVADESVHHLVNKAVVWFEKNKDISRDIDFERLKDITRAKLPENFI